MATIKEKAKRYDEALDKIKRLFGTGDTCTKEEIEFIFPELAESKSEKIRKEIIAFLTYYHTGQGNSVKYDDDWIAWLEKQVEQKHQYNSRPRYVGEGELLGKKDTDDLYLKGVQKICSGEANDEALEKQLQIWFEKGKSQGRDEVIYHPESFGLQKPAEWSEEDENLLKLSLENLTELKDRFGEEHGKVGDCIVWLESIEDRVQPQPKQEWSEEDKNALKVVTDVFEQYGVHLLNYPAFIHWLKTLPNRITFNPYWRPSDEQMDALNYYATTLAYHSEMQKDLRSLWEDLKKLKE